MNFGTNFSTTTSQPTSLLGGGFGQPQQPQQQLSNIFFQQPASQPQPSTSFQSTTQPSTQFQTSTTPFFSQPNLQQQQQQKQQQQKQQQQQQQQQPFNQVTLKTKYSDLPEPYKKELDSIATLIGKQISIAESLHVEEIRNILCDSMAELDHLKKSRGSIEALLQNDHYTIENLRSVVRKEMDRVEIATRIIDAEKKGPSLDLRFNRVYSTLDYFYEKEEEFRRQAEKYAQRLSELEDHVRSLNRVHTTSPQTLIETVRAQNNSFLLLASRVSDLHDAVERTREEFSVYWQHHFGSKQPLSFASSVSKKKSINVFGSKDEDTSVSFKEYANEFVEPVALPLAPPVSFGSVASTTTGTNPNPFQSTFGASSFPTTASASTSTANPFTSNLFRK